MEGRTEFDEWRRYIRIADFLAKNTWTLGPEDEESRDRLHNLDTLGAVDRHR